MLARNKTIYKWLLYAAAAVLCLAVQGALLQRITLWGVIPFLYPLAAVIPATYESPTAGTIFALCVGVVCDLLSRSLLPAGILCSLAAAAASFLLTDGFRCFLLWMSGQGAWQTGGYLMLREFCVTAPLTLPVTLLFRGVAHRVRRLYD